jgi:hypothetical protein
MVNKQNEALSKQLLERDMTIEKLEKEILYFKSVLANVKEISSLINTVKKDSAIPFSTSLNLKKRAFPETAAPVSSKRAKVSHNSESYESTTSEDFEADLSDWMPPSPLESGLIDPHSLDLLSNFSEDDMNLFEDVGLASNAPLAGVCLHVYNKTISLEFCPTCSSRAQEKLACEV